MHSVSFVTDFSFVLCYGSHLVSGEGSMLSIQALRRVDRLMSHVSGKPSPGARFVDFVLGPNRSEMDRGMRLGLG